MLSRLVPKQSLPLLDFAAELTRMHVWLSDLAGRLVPWQLIGARSRNREEHRFASMRLEVLPEADIDVHRPEVRVRGATLRLMPPGALVEMSSAGFTDPPPKQTRAA